MRIVDRELYSNLIVLETFDYDLILGMDFFGKYNTSIECQRHKDMFNPEQDDGFEFIGDAKKKTTLFLSVMKTRKMLANSCNGFFVTP